MKKLLIGSFVFLSLLSGVAMADTRTPLNQDQRITDELTVAAVGDVLRKKCDKIVPKRFVILTKAFQLRDYAMGLGYSLDEIEAFLKNDQERARIKALRDRYLAEHGVKAEESGSYCQLAKDEIAQGSLLGSLMKLSE